MLLWVRFNRHCLFCHRCEPGWESDDCSESAVALPSQLNEQFTLGASRGAWLRSAGGAASTRCGVLGAGPSLHFSAVSHAFS